MTAWYEFACPDCPAAFAVDEPAREELLAVGCVNCGAAVTGAAFERREVAPRMVA
ncbi:DUF7560 family zinc ribbon protein [Haloglomus litoreum]|uniref:DUF7560 family zinc ribbon protein n=1 Tax=Haloglomus litoreum TaxID=3034026 RepID=UPI0023E7C7BE|nr:hypothetical protein [Haloglomus sp. DT116]